MGMSEVYARNAHTNGAESRYVLRITEEIAYVIAGQRKSNDQLRRDLAEGSYFGSKERARLESLLESPHTMPKSYNTYTEVLAGVSQLLTFDARLLNNDDAAASYKWLCKARTALEAQKKNYYTGVYQNRKAVRRSNTAMPEDDFDKVYGHLSQKIGELEGIAASAHRNVRVILPVAPEITEERANGSWFSKKRVSSFFGSLRKAAALW